MNDPERQDGQETRGADNSEAIPHVHILDAEGREYSDAGTAPETKRQKIKNYGKQLLAEKPDRHIELALTLAISFFAAVQLMVTCSNNVSSSDQADKMILITQRNERSASKIAEASKRNAVAAESFSTSAGNINTGVANAVGKLEAQATAIEDSRKSSDTASQKALQFSIDSSRLDKRAWIATCDQAMESFEKGKPIRIGIKFCNSGRTPGYKVEESVMWDTSDHPIDAPPQQYWDALDYIPSNSVPPQGMYILHAGGGNDSAIATQLESTGSKLLDSKFDSIMDGTAILYFYGRIRYRDAFDIERHTEFCITLANPKTKELQYCREHNNLD